MNPNSRATHLDLGGCAFPLDPALSPLGPARSPLDSTLPSLEQALSPLLVPASSTGELERAAAPADRAPGVDVPSTAAVNVTLLTSRGGYRPLGLGWTRPFGFRVHCWDRPGAERAGLFIPAGVSGALPGRVLLRGDLGRLGSGVLVPGLRAVLLTFEAFPVNWWVDVVIPDGVPPSHAGQWCRQLELGGSRTCPQVQCPVTRRRAMW